MGLSLRNLGSKIWDQVNPFDAGLSYSTRQVNPATPPPSVLSQGAHEAVQVGKSVVRAPAQFLNTAAAQVPQVYYTGAAQVAAMTHNNQALNNAVRNQELANQQFNQNKGGLFNAGTFYGAGDAARGDLKTGLQKIGGGTLQTAATVVPFTKGGSLSVALAKGPFIKAVPTLLRQGAAQSAAYSAGQQLQETGRINPRQLVKDTLIGTAANVAIPGVARGAKVMLKSRPLNETGSVPGKTRGVTYDDKTLAKMAQRNAVPDPTLQRVDALNNAMLAASEAPKLKPIPSIKPGAEGMDYHTLRNKLIATKAGIKPLNEKGSAQVGGPLIPIPGQKPKVVLRNPAGSSKTQFNPGEYVKQQVEAQKAAAQGDGTKLTQLKQQFRVKFVDALAPIEDPVIGAVGRKAELPLRDALDRSLRADTLAGRFAEENGLHGIIQGVKNPKAFEQYLIAKHAQDLEANGIKTGRDLGKDQQLIDAVGSEYGGSAKALANYNHRLLDEVVRYGMITEKTAQYLKTKYPNYVPFDRIFKESELTAKGSGKGVANLSTQSVIQRIKGSDRQIQPPLESILAKTSDVIGQGERNSAARSLASYKDIPGNPLGLRELKASETIGTRPTISFFDKGVKRVFETTPEVAAAAKSLNQEQLGFVTKVLFRPATRVLRLGATSANAAFALANVAKDTVSAFINSEHSLRASAANPRVFLDAIQAAGYHGGSKYAELVREGAGGTSFDIARDAAPQTVARIRAGRNVATKTLYTVTHPGELLRAVENTIGRSEEFGRAVQYYGNKQAALAEGKTPAQARMYAADAARNNTVNFARAGEYGRVLNSVLPYLNAGIQGSRTLLRNLKDRPAQTTGKIVLTGFMPVAATTLWNTSDAKRKAAYDNISEYEKQNNIIIVPPNPKQDAQGRWNVIKIPVSQEIANMNNIVRNGVESMIGDKNFNVAAAAGDLIGTGTSLNAQSPNQAVGQITPQAVKPFAELALNKNLFTGQQVVPDALKNLAPQDQANKNTSGTARAISQATGVSPLQVDNAIKTTTGGLGQNIVNLSDRALSKAGVIPADQISGKGLPTSIAQRFSSAQGTTPGAQYFNTIQQESKKVKLAGRDYEALQSILAKEIDSNGKPIPQNDKDTLYRNSTLANNPKVAEVLANTAVKLGQSTGKPVDPLFNLTSGQQNIYYRLQATPYKGDDYNKLSSDNASWLKPFQKERAIFFGDNPITPRATPSDKTPYPTFSNTTQQGIDDYFSITDSQLKSAYVTAHPEVQQALNQIGQYTNDKRVAQGYSAFKDYPQAPSEVARFMAVPKSGRSFWIRNNPQAYQKVQDFFAQSAAYELANNAGAAKYEGTDLNQKALKAAYNLGQYDIAKNPDGSYSLNPSLVSGSKYGNGRSSHPTANAYKYAVSLRAGGSAPRVQGKKSHPTSSKIKVAAASAPKAKVTLKKSRV